MKPSVVAIIKGGLGNQLFAYAAARAFALRRRRELFIDDTSGFIRDGYGRSFRLDRFPVAATPAPANKRLGDPGSAKHKLVRSLNKLIPPGSRSYLGEKPSKSTAQLLGFHSARATIYLNGYWQNEDYFLDNADKIREELEPPAFEKGPDRTLEAELASSPSIFVHIRRRNYFPRLTAPYYQSGIHAAASSSPGCRFEVFGDDLDWARENLDFTGHAVRYHEDDPENELRDFRLMAACRDAIVANSSFSWWAAWLRTSPDKKVWTPAAPGWPVKPAAHWIKVPNRLEQEPSGKR